MPARLRPGQRPVGAAICLWLLAASCSPTRPSDHQLAGVYTLRVETGCGALPADVRTRTFLARIDGNVVTLSGATFWQHPSRGLMNKFQIAVSGDSVALAINQPGGPDIKGIVEETTPGRYFHIVGTAKGVVRDARAGGSEIVGTLSAGFGWGTDVLDDTKHVGCSAGSAATFAFASTTAAFPEPRVALSLLKLEIGGPPSMAPGETTQFTASGRFTDGSSADLTSQVQWHTPFQNALRLTPSGLATAVAFGEATITAFVPVPNLLPAVSAQREIVVVPPQTFRVSGRVVTGSPAQPVFDAEVAVTAGAATGLTTRTDWDGRYSLYGVAGASEIRVSKAGYPPEVRSINAQSHQTLDVTLPTVVVPNISGVYTLTIKADLSCEDGLEASLAVRTYVATIAQSGRQLAVTLSGASFLVIQGLGNGFPGTIDPEKATFLIDDNDHFSEGSNPDVVELLGGSKVLLLEGTMTTDVTPNRLAGFLNGSFIPADRAPVSGFNRGPYCVSTRHEVVFSR